MISFIIYSLAIFAFMAFGIGMMLTISDLRKRHESERANKGSGIIKQREEMSYSD